MLSPNEVIDDKYRIIRLLGEGGMGAVYEGENMRIHRRVAIKVLRGSVADQPDAVVRFEREAQAAGRIGSQHIVEVLDLGTLPGGDRYMVMEYMDGESLAARIQARGRLDAEALVRIVLQLLEGLSGAHGAGIIHRDLKPDNVYILAKHGHQVDFVKILDFGVSKFSKLTGESGFGVTRTEMVVGTPYYMAPEQAKGSKDVDHRADLYAVGVIMYEALTGQLPFVADTFNELMFKIVLERPRPILELAPNVDENLAAIVSKTMARDPNQRFPTAQALGQALVAWSTGTENPGMATMAVDLGTRDFFSTPPATGQRRSAPDARTPDSWFNETGAVAREIDSRRRRRRLWIGLAVALLGAGGLIAALVFFAGQVGSDPVAAGAPSAAPSSSQRGQDLAQLEAARREVERVRAEAELERSQAERARQLAEQEALAERQAREQRLKDQEQAVAAAPRRRPSPAGGAGTPRRSPSESGTPKAADESGSKSTTSKGRPIRTSL